MIVAAVAISPALFPNRQQLGLAGAAASLVDRQRLGDGPWVEEVVVVRVELLVGHSAARTVQVCKEGNVPSQPPFHGRTLLPGIGFGGVKRI